MEQLTLKDIGADVKRIEEGALDNEFLLQDRIQKIQQIIGKYGEDNFYISFSGGKDSTVMSALLDVALPNNNIPRVFADTGIELNMVRDFVIKLSQKDDRIHIIKPKIPVKPMLERDGYPFKSKIHAHFVERYRRIGMCKSVDAYLNNEEWGPRQRCPKKLRYQFSEEFSSRLPISDHCCVNMKEKPLKEWAKANNRSISIVGIMREEGGTKGKRIVFSI